MRIIYCDCCGKKVKEVITLPYTYWIEASVEGSNKITIELDLCYGCYPEVKSGREKPKHITEIRDVVFD